MTEKELRIALVCFGGVSLAVYMHGVTKEILKLVRASAALHAIDDRQRRQTSSFYDSSDKSDPEFDTEDTYFDLLREIGRSLELRVIVDIVAGASAGGVNGAILARALSYDLPIGGLRDLWLTSADVNRLLAPEAKASAWSKWFLRPLVWAAGTAVGWQSIHDREARMNLSLLLRSRWFKPPLSGQRMTELIYEAMATMGVPKTPTATLLPSGQRLDLLVTVTDHYGYEQLVQIHQPALIHEREHRHVFRFRHDRRPGGKVKSDFDMDGVPGLAFAARATSSFPGGFPPAQISEIDELLASHGTQWRRREDFIRRNFQPYLALGIDPAGVYFLDGSVLNNRPFRQAITAIRGRPAYRQVDRRVVYVDPDPALPGSAPRHAMPGFFSVLKSALSDLPSIEPVTEELNWVEEFNERVDRLREIIDDARPHVTSLVSSIVAETLDRPLTVEQIRQWRWLANKQAVSEAGFAYEGYVRLKLASVRAFVSELIAGLQGAQSRSPEARFISMIVDAWATATGRNYDPSVSPKVHLADQERQPHSPRWVEFLLAFDVDFRKRRLHFLIEGQNRLYQLLNGQQVEGFNASVIDRLKRQFYESLDALPRIEVLQTIDPVLREQVKALFPAAVSSEEAADLERRAETFVDLWCESLDRLIDRMAKAVDLEASTNDVEVLLAEAGLDGWSPEARREVLVNYLGFPFWDVLTFPVMRWREVGEFNRILIDRISPQDAHQLAGFNGAASLKGVAFGHFAAFFSRAYRENDYLLGRLHALGRLIDIVCDSAGLNPQADAALVWRWKKRGFLRILDAEERHLANAGDQIAALRRLVERLEVTAAGTRA